MELRIEEQVVVLDDDGHLVDFENWNRDVAKALAAQADMGELGPEQFKVLETIRAYYSKHRVAPMLHLLCRECGMSYRKIHELFHKQPGKRAAKLAGLPPSTGCV